MPRSAPSISSRSCDQINAERLGQAASTPQALALRSRIILEAAAGQIKSADRVRAEDSGGHSRQVATVVCAARHWMGLHDAPRSGRPPQLHAARCGGRCRPWPVSSRSLKDVGQCVPWRGRWACRHSTVQAILNASELQPTGFEPSPSARIPEFEAKLLDIVGLYLNPPENALVLCVDEKPGIQALDRTQPLLPLRGQTAELDQ